MSLPVHLPLRIACAPTSQKSKPNFSRWKKGPTCPPQKPSACKVLHRPRLHLIDHGMFDLGPPKMPSAPLPVPHAACPSGRYGAWSFASGTKLAPQCELLPPTHGPAAESN